MVAQIQRDRCMLKWEKSMENKNVKIYCVDFYIKKKKWIIKLLLT